MLKKAALILFFFLVLAFLLVGFLMARKNQTERGTLSIYFMNEKVGYEEYSWESDDLEFRLEVRGRMDKPLRLEVEKLTIRLTKDFIPVEFTFRGTLNGVRQEVTSTLEEGRVVNRIRAAGQETTSEAAVRRDAILLPNPIFSPYIVPAKRFGCSLPEKAEVSFYIIPQVEIPGSVERHQELPCTLVLTMGGIEVLVETDVNGTLRSLSVPAQKLRIVNESVE